MTPAEVHEPDLGSADGLVDRIRLIEDQPLDTRASAYTALHDELRRVLEGGDRPAS
ncbi:MAG: hypothetical protein M3116_04785 [Actinomycetota bacterium]|nr:hypothetical protein [Actinomycetota bacterium]